MDEGYSNLKTILLCLIISVVCLWIITSSQKTEIMMLRSAFLHFVNCPKCRDKKTTEVKEENVHSVL